MRHAAPDCVRSQLDVEAVQGVNAPPSCNVTCSA
jgi:hypothetical protein